MVFHVAHVILSNLGAYDIGRFLGELNRFRKVNKNQASNMQTHPYRC